VSTHWKISRNVVGKDRCLSPHGLNPHNIRGKQNRHRHGEREPYQSDSADGDEQQANTNQCVGDSRTQQHYRLITACFISGSLVATMELIAHTGSLLAIL
jgi:hypothetical protein